MRIISRRRLREMAAMFPDARAALVAWRSQVSRARWQSLADVRRDYPSADGVLVASGRTVTVFNIRGNHYRLIAAIHYRGQRAYVMRLLTHAQYSADAWKETL